MAQPVPIFAARSSDGLELKQLSPPERLPGFSVVPNTRTVKFSADGQFAAYTAGTAVTVISIKDFNTVQTIEHANVIKVFFSPKNSFVATFSRYQTDKDGQGSDNVRVWTLKSNTLVYSTIARGDEWTPEWSDDETLFGRIVSNEVQLYNPSEFSKAIAKLYLKDVTKYAISPGPNPSIAAFVPSKKGAPAFVRVYLYPNLETPITSKSFFKADTVDLMWNSSGSHLLVHTHVAVDASNKSYYGENHLYYLSAKGDFDVIVQLDKEGPIYATEWSPDGKEFVVVYGFMPAKAMLFGDQCKPLMNFGTGARNAVKFNTQGSVICLAGFGNLRGVMEFWDRKRLRLVSRFPAPDTTHWEWCPDGEHVLTATLSPRLRVGNGYKVWHYDGRLIHSMEYKELVQITWRPAAEGVYPAKPSIPVQENVRNEKAQDAPKPAVYRPPGARGQAASFNHRSDVEEKPQKLVAANGKLLNPVAPGAAPALSKSALKNKKKRDAAKKKTDGDDDKQDAANEQQAPGEPQSEVDLNKKLRALTKKMRQVDDLKKKKEEGAVLEENQLEKLKGEAALRAEIAEVEAALAKL